MRLAWLAISLIGLFPILPSAQAEPVIAGPILHGATMRASGGLNGVGLARGSIFVAFGSGLGPQELVHGTLPYPTQLPLGSDGTRVSFRSLATNEIFDAHLIHSWHSQVAGIIPSALPACETEVRVSYNGIASELTPLMIVDAEPGLFTVNQSGRGAAVVQNYESPSSQPLNGLTSPAMPGQYIILWATGLGPIVGSDNIAPPVGNLRDDIRVRMLGGPGPPISIPVAYAGRAPGLPGVDQINALLPDDGSVDLACYVRLAVEVGDSIFYSDATISTTETPGTCHHPWGLSTEKLADLDNGGNVSFLKIQIGDENGYARLANTDALGIQPFFLSGRKLLPGEPSTSIPSWPGQPSAGGPDSLLALTGVDLDGEILFVGPDGRNFRFIRDEAAGTYFPGDSPYEDLWIGGEWTLRFPGGDGTPFFQTDFWIAPLPSVEPPSAVSLNEDLTLTWDGSGYRKGDVVRVRLQATRAGAEHFERITVQTTFATAGELTFRAGDLAAVDLGPGSTLKWVVESESIPHLFTAENLDYGRINVATARSFDAVPE
ncbi:MAG: hypothetical protein O3A53_13570 [Acidobacteria bacterium]|nr:hypothetical protein [Acidobacteriota bacterium]MDA1235815.1 hypothetical protein [Acidobacteriota bacterium]